MLNTVTASLNLEDPLPCYECVALCRYDLRPSRCQYHPHKMSTCIFDDALNRSLFGVYMLLSSFVMLF